MPGNERADKLATVAHLTRTVESLPHKASDVKCFLCHLWDSLSRVHWFDNKTRESLLFSIDPELFFVVTTPVNRAVELIASSHLA